MAPFERFLLSFGAMPLRKGFRKQVPCPLGLLDIHDAVVVPLAIGRKTNPVYDSLPGSKPREGGKLVDSWTGELTSNEFKITYAYGCVSFLLKWDFKTGCCQHI